MAGAGRPTHPLTRSEESAGGTGMLTYRAKYSFNARTAEELDFNEGDILQVWEDQITAKEWLYGSCDGRSGFIPEEYVKLIPPTYPSPPLRTISLRASDTTSRPTSRPMSQPTSRSTSPPTSDVISEEEEASNGGVTCDVDTIPTDDTSDDELYLELIPDDKPYSKTPNVQDIYLTTDAPFHESIHFYPDGPDEQLYVNVVDGWSPLIRTPQTTMRRKHIDELLDTEELYLQDLFVVMFHLLSVMIDKASDRLRKIITQWETLIIATRTFYKALRTSEVESRDDRTEWMIGKTLQQNLEVLTIYRQYCMWVDEVKPFVNKESTNKLIKNARFLDHTCRWCAKLGYKDLAHADLGVATYLIKPVQRITKYPLLIEKILENTPPEHDDFKFLQTALTQAKELCQHLNKTIDDGKNAEYRQRILEIVTFKNSAEKTKFRLRADRRLLRTDVLHEVKQGIEAEIVAYLSDDNLLLTSPRQSLCNIPSKEIMNPRRKMSLTANKPVMFLDQLTLLDPVSDDPTAFHLLHTAGAEVTSINLKASCAINRDIWVQMIKDAKLKYTTENPTTTPKGLKTKTITRTVPKVQTDKKSQDITEFPTRKTESPTRQRLHSTGTTGTTAIYVAVYEYKTENPSRMNLTKGDILKVSEEQADGVGDWILVTGENSTGWCPRTYLKKIPDSYGTNVPELQFREVPDSFRTKVADTPCRRVPDSYEPKVPDPPCRKISTGGNPSTFKSELSAVLKNVTERLPAVTPPESRWNIMRGRQREVGKPDKKRASTPERELDDKELPVPPFGNSVKTKKY